ncbi:hypothetical protein J6590_077107, partial [Homalodisca vitripennis]
MRRCDLERIRKAEKAASDQEKKIRQKRSMNKRRLQDLYEEGEDPDNPSYGAGERALDWQSLPERLCSRTPASTVLYRTGHSVMNYSFAVVLCVSESVKDIFRLHTCLQDSSLFPHFLITTWPSATADY